MKQFTRYLLVTVALFLTTAAFAQTPGVHRFPIRTDSGPVSWNTGTYQYDAAGNIVAIGPQTYTYDVNGRLVDAHVVGPDGASNQSFVFDPYGNLTSATKDTVATSISVTSGTNRLTYGVYDPSGNVTSYTPPSSAVTYSYTYDGLNMVQKSADSASHQAIYVYTADDERIWTYDLSAGVSHWKVRDLDDKELRDYTDTGTSTWAAKDYFYRGSLLLAATTATSQEHFSVDHLGTPRLITNASQQKIGFHTYYPFGQEWLSAGNDTESRKFTGHERDADPAGAGNDVDYMHARYYMPNVGRFSSVDPTDDSVNPSSPQSFNRYTYAQNSPLTLTDPDGKCPICVVVAIGVIGGIFMSGDVLNAPAPGDKTIPNAGPASAIAGVMKGLVIAGAGNSITSFFSSKINDPADADHAHEPNHGAYAPKDSDGNPQPLPTDKHGNAKADPSAEGRPHTQIGTRVKPTKGEPPYTQARTWSGDGQGGRRIDFTDHGTPAVHPNPHQHVIQPSGKVGPKEPVPEIPPRKQ